MPRAETVFKLGYLPLQLCGFDPLFACCVALDLPASILSRLALCLLTQFYFSLLLHLAPFFISFKILQPLLVFEFPLFCLVRLSN